MVVLDSDAFDELEGYSDGALEQRAIIMHGSITCSASTTSTTAMS